MGFLPRAAACSCEDAGERGGSRRGEVLTFFMGAALTFAVFVFWVDVAWDEARSTVPAWGVESRPAPPELAHRTAEKAPTTTTMALQRDGSLSSKTHDEDEPFYYLHIPKCGGGGAIRTVLGHVGWKNWKRCDFYQKPVSLWDVWLEQDAAHPHCPLFMSESVYNARLATFTMVRQPATHVVSQYFHCKESSDHGSRRSLMPPTLDEWIETWDAFRQGKVEASVVEAFACYNPINLQSQRLAGAVPGRGDFVVLGLVEEFTKSTCLMAIQIAMSKRGHAAGDGMIPKECDCSKVKDHETRDEATFSHGVQHHGSDVVLTEHQRAIIANLTRDDEALYAEARAVFAQQVWEMQDLFQFTLC